MALPMDSMTFHIAFCYAGRYIEIFQSKRMDYYSAIVGQMQSQVRALLGFQQMKHYITVENAVVQPNRSWVRKGERCYSTVLH